MSFTFTGADIESAFSSQVNGTPINVPGVPTGLALSGGFGTAGGTINVTWNAPTAGPITQYNLSRDNGSGYTSIGVGSLLTRVWDDTFTSIGASGTINYKVDSQNTAGTSSFTSPVSITILAAPASVTASSPSAGHMSVSCATVSGASTYFFAVSTSGSGLTTSNLAVGASFGTNSGTLSGIGTGTYFIYAFGGSQFIGLPAIYGSSVAVA